MNLVITQTYATSHTQLEVTLVWTRMTNAPSTKFTNHVTHDVYDLLKKHGAELKALYILWLVPNTCGFV